MSPTPPALLLRLREADVVRLCGLSDAARGLDLAAQGRVTHPERHGAQLQALIHDPATGIHTPPEGYAAWVAAADDAAETLRFGCGCTPAPSPDARACAHVAALLAAWIRHPADFLTPDAAEAPPPARAAEGAIPHASASHAHPPSTVAAESTSASPSRTLLLVDEVARLPSAEVLEVARRIGGVAAERAEQTERAGEADLAPVRAAIVEALGDPLLVEALVARLDPLAGLVLLAITLRGGALTAADLDGIARRMGRPPSALHTAAESLAHYALAFRVSGARGTTPDHAAIAHTGHHAWRDLAGWRVPPDLAARAVSALPLPSAPRPYDLRPTSDMEPPQRPSSPRVRVASPRALVGALALLPFAPRPLNPLRVPGVLTAEDGAIGGAASVPQGRPQRPDVRALPPSRASGRGYPLVPGDLTPQRVGELARVAGLPSGLVRLARRVLLWARAASAGHPLLDLVRLPREAPDAWLDALADGFRLWARAESAPELADLDLCRPPLRLAVDPAHPAFRPAALAEDGARARAVLLRLLRLARPGVWYRAEDLLDLLWHVHPGFLRGRERLHATPPWWLEDASHGQRLRVTHPPEWRMAEGAYVRMLLAGPLAWWGALDIAEADVSSAASDSTSGATAAMAFRVTPLGAYLLATLASGETANPATREVALAAVRVALAGDWGASLLLTRAHELAVQPLAAGAEALAALDLWAAPQAVVAGRIVYAPSPDRACLAFDQGLAPAALLAPLRALHASQEESISRVFRAVAQRLEGWYAAYGATRITRGMALVEAGDEAALVEALAAIPAHADHARRLGPTLALLPTDAADTLRLRLARRGYHLLDS